MHGLCASLQALALEGNYAGEGVDVVDAFGAMAESWLDGGQGKRPAMRDQDMAGRPKVLCARCFRRGAWWRAWVRWGRAR